MTDVYEFGNVLNSLVNQANKLDATKAGQEIDRQMAKHDGALTPRQLWESQKSSRARLHRHFEWNDGEAADKYRDQQARAIIQAVKVVYESDSGDTKQVRAYSSVRRKDNGRRRVFVKTVEAMENEVLREEILQQAINGLVSWRKRWAELSDCADAMNAIDRAVEALRDQVVTETQQVA